MNLHNVWYRGTVEFRWFEGTLHAGKVRAYIQLVLAVAAKALNGRAASSRKRRFNPQSARYDFRVFLLHLGLIGDEFKTARKHLIVALPGDSAFKRGRPKQKGIQSAIQNPQSTPGLRCCRGQITAVIVLKGNRPLELRWHPRRKAVLYASDPAYLDTVLAEEKGWRELPVPPMSLMVFRREDLAAYSVEPFEFVAQERKGAEP